MELVEHNIEVFKQHITEGEPVTITQGNAMDLKNFESGRFVRDRTWWGLLTTFWMFCKNSSRISRSITCEENQEETFFVISE